MRDRLLTSAKRSAPATADPVPFQVTPKSG